MARYDPAITPVAACWEVLSLAWLKYYLKCRGCFLKTFLFSASFLPTDLSPTPLTTPKHNMLGSSVAFCRRISTGSCLSYSAVIEHTNRVIFLEDDDVAAVVDGRLSIHRIKRTAADHPGRAVQTLQMELQQIMKGTWPDASEPNASLPPLPVLLPFLLIVNPFPG